MSDGLGNSGRAIWDAYGAGGLDAGQQALVREFARCADTLDRLDDLAAGRREAWASLVFDDMGEVHLSVDKILDERRQHQIALKQLYGEMRMSGIKPGRVAGGKSKDEEPEDMLAQLRKDRADRERRANQASGGELP